MGAICAIEQEEPQQTNSTAWKNRSSQSSYQTIQWHMTMHMVGIYISLLTYKNSNQQGPYLASAPSCLPYTSKWGASGKDGRQG